MPESAGVIKQRFLDPTMRGPKADRLMENLGKRVIGQTEAKNAIVDAYQNYLSGMAGLGRPVANFLFLGPTGTGKTYLVESTAKSLVGNARGIIKIDCGEFQHSHEIAKIIGSPPGYLGHRQTHPVLSQEALNQFHTDQLKLSFVLFDEIEKASDALWNLLLGIMDKATLTLGDNRRVDFSRTMIFLTSNLGAREMENIASPVMGFSPPVVVSDSCENKLAVEKQAARMRDAGVNAAKRKFTPEFFNRLDKVIFFSPLGREEFAQIIELELNEIQRRVFSGPLGGLFLFTLTDGAKEYLLKEGTSSKYGARFLKRALQRLLVVPFSNLIGSEQVKNGDHVLVEYLSGEALSFYIMEENIPAEKMLASAGIENDLVPQELPKDEIKQKKSKR